MSNAVTKRLTSKQRMNLFVKLYRALFEGRLYCYFHVGGRVELVGIKRDTLLVCWQCYNHYELRSFVYTTFSKIMLERQDGTFATLYEVKS